jgi:hypothetical protein
MQVESVACTGDGHLKVIVYSNFRTRMGDATSSIAIYVGGAIHRSMSVTVAAAQTPLATWPFPVDLSEGIGGIYEGSFDNSAFTDGGPATVSGRFSVCHVANLSSGM